ncbi:hypothetical protein Q5741_18750 [Paenibacillus sp. JX-17]|uniref:ATP-binding protein n=1 Tax=Paenibacillus lacisoli TaxID=3064525 RepID=A0ABT9CGP7_9BACL|nr:hypothetical protein [Paenibacillus sp. JX-17]MDO7908444.1 hypothetical protein [Paenibacillus sp. JX-17]
MAAIPDLDTHEVFGVSNEILPLSYVDRGNLDIGIQRHLRRPTHIALRGESKCGKSWFRQKNIPDAVIVQCRFGKSINDIYTDALSQLGIRLILERTSGTTIKGKVEAETSFGTKLLAKVGIKTTVEGEREVEKTERNVGRDINDLRYIAEIIKESGLRLVIEDFHYLSSQERKKFAYDLKAFWDYGCFIVIIGVWTQHNLITYLNPDLTGRIIELSIYWSDDDLKEVIAKGSEALNIDIDDEIQNLLVQNCFGNVGLLQQLILRFLDASMIYETVEEKEKLSDKGCFEEAATQYADQLNALYQQFGKVVSSGIRKRKDSTGIYAHAMAVIVAADDKKLIEGLELDEIFQLTHARESRIQKNNLRTILSKLEELQVDEDGRGLVIAFNDSTDEISAVDRQLLFYRKYLTIRWPWDDLLNEESLE